MEARIRATPRHSLLRGRLEMSGGPNNLKLPEVGVLFRHQGRRLQTSNGTGEAHFWGRPISR
jgi:hypothetical protein